MRQSDFGPKMRKVPCLYHVGTLSVSRRWEFAGRETYELYVFYAIFVRNLEGFEWGSYEMGRRWHGIIYRTQIIGSAIGWQSAAPP